MPRSHIEHFLVATDDIVHIGPSTKLAGENQKKHLGRTSQDTGTGTGVLDHIAFRATGLAEMRGRLQRLNIPHRERSVPSLGLHQVFFEDPSSVTIELNYPAAEAVTR